MMDGFDKQKNLPEETALFKQMQHLSSDAQQALLSSLDPTSTGGVAPFFLKTIGSDFMTQRIYHVFDVLGIHTLFDLVQYDSIESLDQAYQKSTSATKPLRSGTIKEILKFMQHKEISFGMDVGVLCHESKEQEKRRRLLSLSFDLSDLVHKKAMEEYGIHNTSGIFTKLYATGIRNFEDLIKKYPSEDSILVVGFGRSSKIFLRDYMDRYGLSFGMDLSAYMQKKS